MKRCGDNGGKNRKGQPCTTKLKPGQERCARHNDATAKKEAAAKVTFLESYREGTTTLQNASTAAGVSRITLWRMRQLDPEFDKAVLEAQAMSDRTRLSMVEDSMFMRLVKGEASAAEVIFYLVNRGNGRWRNVQQVVHQGADGGPIQVEVTRTVVGVLPELAEGYVGGNGHGAAERISR